MTLTHIAGSDPVLLWWHFKPSLFSELLFCCTVHHNPLRVRLPRLSHDFTTFNTMWLAEHPAIMNPTSSSYFLHGLLDSALRPISRPWHLYFQLLWREAGCVCDLINNCVTSLCLSEHAPGAVVNHEEVNECLQESLNIYLMFPLYDYVLYVAHEQDFQFKHVNMTFHRASKFLCRRYPSIWSLRVAESLQTLN